MRRPSWGPSSWSSGYETQVAIRISLPINPSQVGVKSVDDNKGIRHEYVREERSWCETQPGRNPTEQSQAGHVAPRVGKPAQGLHPGTTVLQDIPTQAWLPRVAEPPVRQRSLQWPFRPPQASV